MVLVVIDGVFHRTAVLLSEVCNHVEQIFGSLRLCRRLCCAILQLAAVEGRHQADD